MGAIDAAGLLEGGGEIEFELEGALIEQHFASSPRERASDAILPSLLRVDSQAWDRRYAGRELLWTSQPNRFLVEEAADLEPGRALDLACGEGRNAVWLAERGWRVIGVDFSGVALEKGRELAHARAVRVEWVAADVLEYAPEPEAFELVLVFYLQVPQAQLIPILQTAAEAVAPGGTFLLVGHDRSNIAEGHGGPQDPAVLYTVEDVTDGLRTTGLRIDRAQRVSRLVQTPEGQRIALDALVRASRP